MLILQNLVLTVCILSFFSANIFTNCLPDFYRLQTSTEIQGKSFDLRYTANEEIMFYRNQDDLSIITFRKRNSTANTYVRYWFPYINQMQMNKNGDYLVVGNLGKIYLCKVQNISYITNRDTFYQIDDEISGQIQAIAINSLNQVAVSTSNKMLVLNITNDGKFVVDFMYHYNDQNIFLNYFSLFWDPVDESNLFFAASNYSSGFFMIFNVRNQIKYVINNLVTTKIGAYPDGSIILQATKENLLSYEYSKGKVDIASGKTVLQKPVMSFKVSSNGLVLVACIQGYSSPYYYKYIQAFQISLVAGNQVKSKGNNDSSSEITEQKNPLELEDSLIQQPQLLNRTMQLRSMFKASLDSAKSFTTSQDGNQFLIFRSIDSTNYTSKTFIDRYTLCIENTYLSSDGSCYSCQNNCSTCRFRDNICTLCANNSLYLQNFTCKLCSEKIEGCSTCFNSSVCLTCNTKLNWNSTAQNGKCVCVDFTSYRNGNCTLCDSNKNCKTCTSEGICTKCDTQKKWQENAVNGSCQCKYQYTNINNTCLSCNIKGCYKCSSSDYCSQCNSFENYTVSANDLGLCTCLDGYEYSLQHQTCVKSESNGRNSDDEIPSEIIVLIVSCFVIIAILLGFGLYQMVKRRKEKRLYEENKLTERKPLLQDEDELSLEKSFFVTDEQKQAAKQIKNGSSLLSRN